MASTNPWVAMEAGVDPVEWARTLRDAHERWFTGMPPVAKHGSGGLRSVIAASWRRSARAGILPDGIDVPFVLDAAALAERRAASGLSEAVPALRDVLGAHASDAHHLMIVTDAEGHLLWVEGDRTLRRDAERIALTAGALWREDAAGTNAMGTALALDHPVQIFAAEHVRQVVHDWTCAAAPLRHPATGALLGCVDLTGPVRTVHPHTLALVSAAAAAVAPLLAAAEQTPELRLRALGTDRAVLEWCGRRIELSPRHSEIVVLLAMHPRGLSTEQLALELFGESGKPVSVRAELSRLRRLLGPALEAPPYRLAHAVSADFLTVRDHIDTGAAAAALRDYSGRLLPSSEAPGIVEARGGIDNAVRRAALVSGDDYLLRAWVESAAGERDLPALELLLRRRPRDPGVAHLGKRALRLRAEEG